MAASLTYVDGMTLVGSLYLFHFRLLAGDGCVVLVAGVVVSGALVVASPLAGPPGVVVELEVRLLDGVELMGALG